MDGLLHRLCGTGQVLQGAAKPDHGGTAGTAEALRLRPPRAEAERLQDLLRARVSPAPAAASATRGASAAKSARCRIAHHQGLELGGTAVAAQLQSRG